MIKKQMLLWVLCFSLLLIQLPAASAALKTSRRWQADL